MTTSTTFMVAMFFLTVLLCQLYHFLWELFSLFRGYAFISRRRLLYHSVGINVVFNHIVQYACALLISDSASLVVDTFRHDRTHTSKLCHCGCSLFAHLIYLLLLTLWISASLFWYCFQVCLRMLVGEKAGDTAQDGWTGSTPGNDKVRETLAGCGCFWRCLL